MPWPIKRLLLAGAVAVALSCGDRTTTGPLQASVGGVVQHTRSPVRSLAKNASQLAQCRPLPPDLVLKRIGPAGGIIDVGPYTLTIPRGALDRRVTIAARIPSGVSVNFVEFKPDGLVFLQPASLAMSYANCDLPDETGPLQIAFVDDSLRVVYYLPSVYDMAARTVTGTVEHFSNYAVAY
jgi:hypothetical protein